MEDSHDEHELHNAREATPPADRGNELEGSSRALPAPRPDQLQYHEKELNEAMRQLEKERVEVRRQMGHRGDGGRARDHACEVNRQIVDDKADLPKFIWASQNIAVAAAGLAALPEPAEPEECREHDKLSIFSWSAWRSSKLRVRSPGCAL